jgi:hypothetical protein
MADLVRKRESNIGTTVIGQKVRTSSGSESMACIERWSLNVGDPSYSRREGSIDRQVSTTRRSKRWLGSQMRHSSDEVG